MPMSRRDAEDLLAAYKELNAAREMLEAVRTANANDAPFTVIFSTYARYEFQIPATLVLAHWWDTVYALERKIARLGGVLPD